MTDLNFKALLVTDTPEGFKRAVTTRSTGELPAGEVLIKVSYSSLNYKDALSAIGNRGVTRHYPHTPGIDAAGVVAQSSVDTFNPGDEVIVTSYDLGMETSGGFGGYIRVPAAWVVPLPEGLGLREAMIYGTAGFTAAQSVLGLTEVVPPESGDILVSGATGGVGSFAVSFLVKLGYEVVAVNGVVDEAEYLKSLGAKQVISIDEATDTGDRPLLKARWSGSIDTVGGQLLATTIRTVDQHGAVTSCGNVASHELPLSVYPFILRGVTLIGINSQNCPMERRLKVWEKLAGELRLDGIERIVTEVDLDGLDAQIEQMLAHKNHGRTLVRLEE